MIVFSGPIPQTYTLLTGNHAALTVQFAPLTMTARLPVVIDFDPSDCQSSIVWLGELSSPVAQYCILLDKNPLLLHKFWWLVFSCGWPIDIKCRGTLSAFRKALKRTFSKHITAYMFNIQWIVETLFKIFHLILCLHICTDIYICHRLVCVLHVNIVLICFIYLIIYLFYSSSLILYNI